MELQDKHIQRLTEWLRLKGFTSEEILECIEFLTK